MKAALLEKFGEPLKIADVAMPVVGPFDVLVKTAAAGICHTDLGIIDGHVPIGRLPMILGHEVAGEVVAVGSHVEMPWIGKRVCVSYGLVCGVCAQCHDGNDTLCDHWQTMGRTVNGGFAEFIAIPVDNVIALPDNIPYEQAAIIPCSVATAFHAVRRAGVSSRSIVAILGIGGVGLNAVQFATLAGANVIAVDVIERKLDLARAFGAQHTINAATNDATAAIKEATGGVGADVCLEFVGSSRTYKTAIQGVRRGGMVVIAGFHPNDISINPLRLMLDEVIVTGAHVANRSEIREIVDLLANGKISLQKMVTHTLDFADIASGLDQLRRQDGDPIRIVVKF
jgi:2-desacetyl-2-hydroxyethyl bacteriochlorophyllide A dehydrogenase